MKNESKRNVILVTSYVGQMSRTELERMAASGEGPRKDYVELARLLDAEVIDNQYMEERASPLARAIARRAGVPAGQVTEAFLRRKQYKYVVVWADRLGLPLALLYKLSRSRRNIALISAWSSDPKKAFFLQRLKVHSHLRVMINDSSLQMTIAANRLGIPKNKLYQGLQSVDDRFWYPGEGPTENLICSVGSEERDYPTLIEAVRNLDIQADLVIGSATLLGQVASSSNDDTSGLANGNLPSNVRLLSKLPWTELRQLYRRSRFVVVPLRDVEFNAGVTALVEAMSMGKAVVVTSTLALMDFIQDGEQGLYVPPGDPKALREAIEYLMNHPDETDRMGRAGRALVEERYTMDTCMVHLATIIRSGAASGDMRSDAPARRTDGGS